MSEFGAIPRFNEFELDTGAREPWRKATASATLWVLALPARHSGEVRLRARAQFFCTRQIRESLGDTVAAPRVVEVAIGTQAG